MLNQTEFLLSQLAWLVVVGVGLAVLGLFTLESFVLVAFVGFLCAVALTAPTGTQPPWRRRLKWAIGAGVVLSAVIVARRIATIV